MSDIVELKLPMEMHKGEMLKWRSMCLWSWSLQDMALVIVILPPKIENVEWHKFLMTNFLSVDSLISIYGPRLEPLSLWLFCCWFNVFGSYFHVISCYVMSCIPLTLFKHSNNLNVCVCVLTNHNCLLSWLLNGGMSSPMTSGQQKVYTSSAAN